MLQQILNNKRLSLVAVILFFICIASLLGYLLSLRFYEPLPFAVFWASIIIAILTIVFQITRIPWPGHEGILVAEILTLGITLHMIYRVPFYGMQDFDSIRNMVIMDTIVEQGILLPSGSAELDTNWPLADIWGAMLHDFTGITTAGVVNWFPSLVLSSVFALILYILAKKVFKSEPAALLAMLLMLTLTYFTSKMAIFCNQVFALVLMITLLFLLTKSEGNNRTKFAVLSIICLVAVTYAHHLTPVALLFFLFSVFVINHIIGSATGNWLSCTKKPTLIVTGTFLLLAFVIVFSYSLFVYKLPLSALAGVIRAMFFSELGSATSAQLSYVIDPEAIISIRGKIVFWGFYFFHALFALILLREFFLRRKEKQPEFYSFAIFLFICGAWGILDLYFLPRKALTFDTNRILLLGWVWGFPPLTICIWESRRKWGKHAGIALLTLFMIYGMYSLPNDRYSPQQYGWKEGSITLMEDYALAETLPLTGTVAAPKKTAMPIYQVQRIYYQDIEELSIDELGKPDCLIIKKGAVDMRISQYEPLTAKGRYYRFDLGMLYRLREMITGNSITGRDRIYESNNLVVFK